MVKSLLQVFPVSVKGNGVVKNSPANLLGDRDFQDLSNCKLLNGVLSKSIGWSKFVSQQLTGKVVGLDQFFLSSGSDFFMVVTETHIYKWNTGTVQFDDLNGTALTGTVLNPISMETAFDLFLVTNNIDTIKKWDGITATYLALGGLTDVEKLDGTGTIVVGTAGTVRFFQNFVVLLDVTENGTRKPYRTRWSRLGLPENWKNDASGNGQAGAADVGTADFIQTAEQLANSLAIYKERSIWLMNYIGVPIIMDFRQVVSGVGVVGPHAVGNFGDEHMFVGNDNIYFFNGDSIDPVGENVRKYFFENAHPKYLNLTMIFIVEEDTEAWVMYASNASTDGSFDKALIFNYLERTWVNRDLTSITAAGYYRRTASIAWNTDSGTWDNPDFPGTWDQITFLDNAPLNMLGDANGYVHQIKGNSADGTAITMKATTKLYDFGAPHLYKRVQRVQLFIKKEGNYTVTVNVGVSENIDDDPVYTSYTYNLSSTTNPYLEMDVFGRFFTFQFQIAGTAQNFEMTGFNIYYMLRGPRG